MQIPYYLSGLGGQPLLLAENPALAKFRAGLAVRAQLPCRVVMVGSSTTEGYLATVASARYVNRVAARIQASFPSGVLAEAPVLTVNAAYAAPSARPGVHVYNAGVAGTTSSTYLTPTDVTRIGALNPRMVVHMIGSNDWKDGVSLATYRSNVLAQIAALKGAISGPCVHLLVHSYARGDVPAPAVAWSAFGEVLYRIALGDPDNVAFLDLSRLYGLVGTPASDPLNLYNSDTVHQDDAGHALMADLIYTGLRLPDSRSPALQVADTFTRPDSASTLGVADTGHAWTALSGTWGISGGKAYQVSAGTAVVETGLADVDLTCVVTHSGAAHPAGVVFRCSDDSNRWSVSLDQGGGQVSLFRTDGGSAGSVANFPMTITAREYVVRVHALGAVVNVFVDGVKVITYTLSGPDQTKFGVFTRCGLRCSTLGAAVRWDGFSVQPAT